MSKTMQMIKVWNFLNNKKIKEGKVKPIEVEAQIDNGCVRVVLPTSLAKKLGLEIRGTTKVRYADMRIEEREVAFGLMLDILDRETEATAILEPEREIPLIGQIILEDLDLWIDSRSGKLIPNPESPNMPILDEI